MIGKHPLPPARSPREPETVDINETRDIPCGLIAVALMYLHNVKWFEWRFADARSNYILSRQPLAAKAAALIAHDRILNGELEKRGLPPIFIT
jgi:hypothetical protein